VVTSAGVEAEGWIVVHGNCGTPMDPCPEKAPEAQEEGT
jgi:hypothetical protein